MHTLQTWMDKYVLAGFRPLTGFDVVLVPFFTSYPSAPAPLLLLGGLSGVHQAPWVLTSHAPAAGWAVPGPGGHFYQHDGAGAVRTQQTSWGKQVQNQVL